MPYRYLEDVGAADIAFEVTGGDLPELFTAAADTTMNDAKRLLLRVCEARIEPKDAGHFLEAQVAGEQLDDTRYQQRADVKAVTLHGFSVKEDDGNWKARVLLDI
ncbi:MAG TPA: archease [Candidatus Udaeobacter sp.]